MTISNKFKELEAEENKKAGSSLPDSAIRQTNSDLDKLVNKLLLKYSKPKPIFRELLIHPAYLIFIHGFRYEEEVKRLMKNHESRYPLYMGNSEFPATYTYIDGLSFEKKPLNVLDSFTGNPGNIRFEPGKRYTHIYATTRTTGDREYRDFKSLVVCDQPISLSKAVEGYRIETKEGSYGCEFV